MMRCTVVWWASLALAAWRPLVASALPTDERELTRWTFRNGNGSIAIHNATVPGASHVHLWSAGLIPDPHERYNERALAWVAAEMWHYETTFELPERRPCHLRAATIDGPATLVLNGVPVAATANSFLAYAFDLTAYVRAGSNHLSFVFEPPLAYTARLAAAYPYYVPATVNPNTWAEPTHRPFLRKAGSDFGWDWGPAFVPVGLAGPVHLVLPSACTARLDDYTVDQTHAPDMSSAHLVFRGFVDGFCNDTALALHVRLGNATVAVAVAPSTLTPAHLEATYTLRHPELWWPNGYGRPHLYDVELILATTSGTRLDARRGQLGIRSIVLDQSPAIPRGHHFRFVINGRRIFVRGANWVPSNVFPTTTMHATLAHLVTSATTVHMNMVRVWGGGRYESDAFYAFCDAHGLLVWQELMFACAAYPRDDSFLATVADEVRYQVRRLNKFTSIVVWGGNNENESIMDQFANGWFLPDGYVFNRDRAVTDYVKVFVDTVAPIVLAADPGRPFLDSSPSNGVLSTSPYVKRWENTSSVDDGDVHYYNIVRDCMDWTQYPAARFVSEFGFQSMPSAVAWATVTDASDWATTDAMRAMLAFRQRSPNGTEHIQHQLDLQFASLPTTGSVAERLRAYTWLTQVQQGLCYATAIGTWRRLGATGVLYWQLNDVWVGPSWSSIDVYGHWKALHAMVIAPFAPQAIVVHEDATSGSISATIVSDVNATTSVRVSLYRFSAAAIPLQVLDTTVAVDSEMAVVAWHADNVTDLLATHDCNRAACFLTVASPSVDDEVYHFFRPFKDLPLLPAVVVTTVVEANATSWSFQVSCASGHLALFVTLETAVVGQWSANVMHLRPGSSRLVVFWPATPAPLAPVTTTHLFDAYTPTTHDTSVD
ncbi:hypothetical protein SPRG_11371 [Saprolegnia parasitica CBS 223.65]|uniref:beta-mannosidase n=1 Tax=Saprolegnia parasitica (strain CBS 223.65) TaxID=695850 RepID=A0A067C9F7_SAPPC|nr:hypothetical protein SPRG_11371 [Saprolegnia parasitica CBS 223.65]KDO23452.1 hypothetical protein SPRG_11371 [Saprolegnia parasitica CBS 223.65]|eukprot:XP_012205767.1 hypothetical protein SPRG_11371 [Saprolegnia parasitica CBS 223.65]